MAKKILVTERIADEGIESLRKRGYEVDIRYGLTPEELIEVIPPYDALIVRSGTQVDDAVIAAAENLKIIGRAGVTVDNIDIDAATARDIIVCNAPTSNTISAAEHAFALMLAAARRLPQANDSMKAGEWNRSDFTGTELYGKTLAIFGLGRIGELMVQRARAFGMKLVAYDPYCSLERAEHLGVRLYDSVDDVLPVADFISVHLPRTADTYHMFGPEQFAAMKDGVIIVNAARGGIYDLDSLADFVAAGKVVGAAIDVYEEEPCYSSPLHELDGAILTPHIAAVTKEAQVRAGKQIAEAVWAGLEGSIVPTAINASPLPPEVMNMLTPYVPACKMMGRMLSQILGGTPKLLNVTLAGSLCSADPSTLVSAALDGMLPDRKSSTVTAPNAVTIAARYGIHVETEADTSAREYAAAVRVEADGMEVASTLYGMEQKPRIISLLGYKIDIVPSAHGLVFEYEDAPGRIGAIGTILGDAGVNITTMQIGRSEDAVNALVYMNVENEPSEEVLEQLRTQLPLKNLWSLTL